MYLGYVKVNHGTRFGDRPGTSQLGVEAIPHDLHDYVLRAPLGVDLALSREHEAGKRGRPVTLAIDLCGSFEPFLRESEGCFERGDLQFG